MFQSMQNVTSLFHIAKCQYLVVYSVKIASNEDINLIQLIKHCFITGNDFLGGGGLRPTLEYPHLKMYI